MFASKIKTLAILSAVCGGLALFAVDTADAASCSNFQSTCAANCRTRHPTDKSCVSDHCSPKLATCKSSGCWQQGGDFGNKLTCNLDKK